MMDSFHPEDGSGTFLWNVGSYESHTAHVPAYGILHSHRRENLKYYIALTGWPLAEK
jgi:hypothetical protein